MIRMLKILFKLSLLGLVLAIISCDPFDHYRPKNEVVFDRDGGRSSNTRSKGKNFSGSCKKNGESDIISMRDLDYIDSNNAGEYLLQGRCDKNKENVFIAINGYEINNHPICSGGRWEVELNLSSVVSTQRSIVFQVTHNRDSICKDIKVAFSGPSGYIPIPPPLRASGEYYKSSFFVMKYEAKVETRNASSQAISKVDGVPITRITREEAITLCRNNGPRYDLMSNSQWQNIALSIEETEENWMLGKDVAIDENAINCGVFRGTPQAAKTNDRDDCADSSCYPSWDVKRRTHILNNGEAIWDICGNVGEIMKDKYTAGENFKGDIFELNGKLKDIFGPKKTYSLSHHNRRVNKWNLGYAEINSNYDLIVRGMPSTYAGVFSVEVKRHQNDRRGDPYVGFRCVYLP